MNDQNSAVYQWKDEPLNYALLAGSEHAAAHDVSGRPVRNPNPGDSGEEVRAMSRNMQRPTPRVPTDRELAAPTASPPVIGPGYTFRSVTDKISSITLTRRTPRGWWLGFAFTSRCVMMLLYTIGYLLFEGVGIWGINIPVAWGFAIVNFVWWIGIGHAGTLISAILLLLHQKWRTSINRFAEAMTLFAVACAGLFPLLHLGRPWFFYWLFPYPNTMEHLAAVPQPAGLGRVRRLDLRHRVAAVLVRRPDPRPGHPARSLARTASCQIIYGILAMGWRGSARHWKRYEMTYLDPGRPGDAAGRVGAYGRQLRFRRRHPARLAFDDLSALFCRRSDLFRLRHGADAGHSAADFLRLAGLHHACATCKTWPRSCWRPA